MEYRTELAGDSDTGVLHSGVISAQLDATCSGAVLVKLGALTRLSTLELRVDTLKPSTIERTLYASCHCVKLTQPSAFVEGVAYHLNEEGERDIIAKASGTIMMMLPKPGAAL